MPETVYPYGKVVKRSRPAVGRIAGRLSKLVGSSSTVKVVGRFLRQQLWAWPLIAAVVLSVTGYLVKSTVESSMRRQRENELTTILRADVAAMRVWMTEQGRNAALFAADDRLRSLVNDLIVLAKGPSAGQALLLAPAQAVFRRRLAPRLKTFGYIGYLVISPSGLVLAADQDAAIGQQLEGYRRDFFARVLETGPSTSKPFRTPLLLRDAKGELRADLPTMHAAAPLEDESGKPAAVLSIRISPGEEFTSILQVARSGETGETNAFDRSGLFLSNSRFDDDLKQLGLLPDLPDVHSVLTLEVRNPGVDLTTGQRTTVRRQYQPLTRMAAEAAQGRDGCDANGYPNYAGATVVGAWTWLRDFDFGVATEIRTEEAFGPVHILRAAFWSLIALLGLAAAGIYVAMVFLSRQQRLLQSVVSQATRLGQYTLEEKLGEGGMGTVYRARHAMLRRPTAVKLLDVEKVSPDTINRFEREVQTTSTLTHPNTIQIYDFGLTPEGVFYYVMELLEGTDLDALVQRTGPLPEARVVYLLRQACGSLAEAHAAGLIHRDVKPANLFLTRRGGMCDFVKVLDFGLVKSLVGKDDVNVTAANSVPGTPLYLSPEAATEPDRMDARADVYALGAVAYYLLTGQPVFDGNTITEIIMKHVRETPSAPSIRIGRPVSITLEALILRCLSKAKTDRPTDARQLLDELDQCQLTENWSPAMAASWWFNHFPNLKWQSSHAALGPAAHPVFSAAPDEAGRTVEYQHLPEMSQQ